MSRTGSLVFHGSSELINGEWYPSRRYCDDKEKLSKAKTVNPGDIIINRIGRYARYWCVCKDEAFVSDCLIVIKSSDMDSVCNKLNKNTVGGRLNISTKGVTTQFITKNDVCKILY